MDTVYKRFIEERERLGLKQGDVAELCGVRKATVSAWENGSKIPPEALAILMGKGLDVFYVLVGPGIDGPQPLLLTLQEREVMDGYRSLSEVAQGQLRAYLHAKLESDVSKGTARGVRERKKQDQ
ncbi:MAG: helix-turn-helix transcriptional regulator [Gammaproteobacteria bacterium]|nr:helix-turn-helix transcriptional regulator [Gammaproteobacteria bacterium]